MTVRFWLSAGVLLALVLTACSPAAPSPTAAPPKPAAQPTSAPGKSATQAAKPATAPAKQDTPIAKPAANFAGKNVRLIVGLGAGGGYDTYMRTIARHINEYLPGNPNIVVENMVGGGSLVAANYIAKKADPDGLTVGDWNSNMILQAALGANGPQFRGDEFEWIGAPSNGIPTCAVMGFTGSKTWKDVVSSGQEFKMGATAVGSTTGDLPLILKDTTDAQIKLVEGYDGTAEIRRAMAAREVDGACWGWESMSTTGKAMLEATGEDQMIPVLIEGKVDDPLLKNAVQISSVIKDPDHLSGFNAWLGPYEFQRPMMLPPGTPEHIVAAWREAFNKTMKDQEFLAEVKKADLYLAPVTGEEIEKSVAKIWAITPKAKEFLQETIIKNMKKS